MGQLTAVVDTSVLIDSLEIVETERRSAWAVSVVTVGELHAGVLLATHGPSQATRLQRLSDVLSLATVLDITRSVAVAYGELRMAAPGRVPANDLWIAACAVAYDLELVTADKRQAALPYVRAQLV
jgi:predicted nucleic acid-binding protein